MRLKLCMDCTDGELNNWEVGQMHEFEFRYTLHHRVLEDRPEALGDERRAYIEKVLKEYQAVSKGHRDAKRVKEPFYWEEILFRLS